MYRTAHIELPPLLLTLPAWCHQVKNRLDQLDDLSAGGQQQLLDLGQQEYVVRSGCEVSIASLPGLH